MGKLFQFQTDADTVESCLGIIERANERVRLGKSAFLGTARSACTARKPRKSRSRAKGLRKSRPIPEAERAQIVRLLRQGLAPAAAAREVGCAVGRVYWVRESEGLTGRRAA